MGIKHFPCFNSPLAKYVPGKNAALLFFNGSANRYDLGLSNEPVFIIIGQGATKLWPFKVGSQKKIQPGPTWTPFY